MISLTSPVKTAAHTWPAMLKLAALCIATLCLFVFESLPFQLAAFVLMLGLYALPGKVFFTTGLRRMRIVWPFVLVIAIWHLITREIDQGILIILRMLTAVGLANLVTMTTRLSDLVDVITRLTAPLRWMGLKTKTLEMSIALVIRFTPVLIENGKRLNDAWRARASSKTNWRIIFPLIIAAIDDADHVAEALKARGGL